MFYLVTRWNGLEHACIQRDGTEEPDRNCGDLYGHQEALAVAKKYGGFLMPTADAFPQDWNTAALSKIPTFSAG